MCIGGIKCREKNLEASSSAIQMQSENGLIEQNLAKALRLVEEAAKKKAKLIVLPEFMPPAISSPRQSGRS